jgi:pimeloyl-ACP methyl ester carboxylesterase
MGRLEGRIGAMATFVLVHPAWFGGWCWQKVNPRLRAAGHAVRAPTLTGLGERAHLATAVVGLGTHLDDVVNVLEFEDLTDVILVGTSSGGTVVTGVADRVLDRIAQLVYVDAFVPEDGESTWELIPRDRRPAMEQLVKSEGEGWLLPRFSTAPWDGFLRDAWGVTDEAERRWVLDRLRPTPLGHLTEPVRLAHDPPASRAYVRCRRWPNPLYDRYAATARSSPGWTCRDLDASHVPYVTAPDQLAAALLDLAG